MSYTGFFAETDLYEVAKNGDAAKGSWVVPVERAEGIADVLLLGMGGASRAAEVLNNVFARPGMPRLAVLDSTLPEAILAHAGRLGPEATLIIVATKSGSTIETLSLFRFFYDWAARALGPGEAGDHFVAITDPGGRLEELARTHEFRATFLNDPNVGGRYSALSFFGLLPAALVGVDVKALLERARALAAESRPCDDSEPGVDVAAWLGVVMAELARVLFLQQNAFVPEDASFAPELQKLYLLQLRECDRTVRAALSRGVLFDQVAALPLRSDLLALRSLKKDGMAGRGEQWRNRLKAELEAIEVMPQ